MPALAHINPVDAAYAVYTEDGYSRRVNTYPPLTLLSSYTHNYPPPPPGYDDSAAGGGRTYFLQPLRFRRDGDVDAKAPAPSQPIVARRRGPASALSVYTGGLSRRARYARYTRYARYAQQVRPVRLARRAHPDPSQLATPVAKLISPKLAADVVAKKRAAANTFLMKLAAASKDSKKQAANMVSQKQAANIDSPVPLLQRDDTDTEEGSDTEVETRTVTESRAAKWRRENPRVRSHRPGYAVSPAPRRVPFETRQSLALEQDVSEEQRVAAAQAMTLAWVESLSSDLCVDVRKYCNNNYDKIGNASEKVVPASRTARRVVDVAGAQMTESERCQLRRLDEYPRRLQEIKKAAVQCVALAGLFFVAYSSVKW